MTADHAAARERAKRINELERIGYSRTQAYVKELEETLERVTKERDEYRRELDSVNVERQRQEVLTKLAEARLVEARRALEHIAGLGNDDDLDVQLRRPYVAECKQMARAALAATEETPE